VRVAQLPRQRLKQHPRGKTWKVLLDTSFNALCTLVFIFFWNHKASYDVAAKIRQALRTDYVIHTSSNTTDTLVH
jgi:hypothetical protein